MPVVVLVAPGAICAARPALKTHAVRRRTKKKRVRLRILDTPEELVDQCTVDGLEGLLLTAVEASTALTPADAENLAVTVDGGYV